jgi:peptidoglycan L-alanyl-D-glutamate endopeptidase CwlK
LSKELGLLELGMRAKVYKTIAEMQDSKKLRELGVEEITVVETKRTLAVQMAYYSRGRMNAKDVKEMYRVAGLYALSTEEANTKNTWTLESKHIEGKAVDIAPMKNGVIWWNAPAEVWQTMGEIGESCGLKWGGRWKDCKDTPHFEV